ncbi:MAG: hypothetical protein WA071_25680 [Undibacterium umbellatum]|uniref:hypothetical protein n=1 Tax=Undibacterium umbellatum TaxID=2762300 RepID=UPI003BB6F22C
MHRWFHDYSAWNDNDRTAILAFGVQFIIARLVFFDIFFNLFYVEVQESRLERVCDEPGRFIIFFFVAGGVIPLKESAPVASRH